MKANSPLLGFNNNVKHKGRVFHVQTEDSGVKHPHVITHLFVDGGRILKSTKTSYAEFLEDEDLKHKVRLLMQEQHKAMFIALRAGKFDHMVEATGEAPPPPPSSEAASARGEVPASALTEEAAAVAAPTPMPVPEPPPSSAGASSAREVPPSEGSRPAASSPSPIQPTSAPASAPQAPSAAAPAPRAPSPAAGRPATQPPSSGSPVSLRPPSLLPPPPRAPLPSVNSERSPFVSERGSITNERAASLDRPATAPDRMAAAERRQADPRAETLQALPQEPHRPRLASPLELNLEALERSASDTRPSLLPEADIRDLPPPPAGVLGKKPASINTSYRSIQHADPRAEQPGPEDRPARPSTLSRGLPSSGEAPASVRSPSLAPPNSRPRTMPMPQPATPPPGRTGRSVVPPRSLTPQGARYAASRPASIFGSARPQEGSSIFGEDLISEKSLDEVILSYLAEDLEGGKTKR